MAKRKSSHQSETYANALLSLGFIIFASEVWFFLGLFSSFASIVSFVLVCCVIFYCTNRFIWQYKERSFAHFYQQQNARFSNWKEQAKTFYDTQYPHLDFGENRTFNYFKKAASIQSTGNYCCRSTLHCEATPINQSITLTYKWVLVKTQQVLGNNRRLDLRTIKVVPTDLIECHVTAQSPCGTKTTTIDTVKVQPLKKQRKKVSKPNKRPAQKPKQKRSHNPMWDASVNLKKQVYYS